jgi:hypothetical protein
LDPGSGSGSHLFEPRLARLRLRLGVFEPMDNFSHYSMLERVSFSSVEKEDVKVLSMIELLPAF